MDSVLPEVPMDPSGLVASSCSATNNTNERASAEEMDEKRKQNIAYEYLCHLEEAKVWMEACLNEELPPTTELEENLRNGVYLAKLANFFLPKLVPVRKIYDVHQTRYKTRGLHFRHTDNINHWISAMQELRVPENILPETTDVYDKKNMPRVVYCLHALSLFLHKHGLAPKIQDLYGKVKFTEEEISAMSSELEKYGIQMPTFSTIGGILADQMPVDEASCKILNELLKLRNILDSFAPVRILFAKVHAAIIAVNETVDKHDVHELGSVLSNPAAHLSNVDDHLLGSYQEILAATKLEKLKNAKNRPSSPDEYAHDVYDEMLTRVEIQECLNRINCDTALEHIRLAVVNHEESALIRGLNSPCLNLKNIVPINVGLYVEQLAQATKGKKDNNNYTPLSKEDVQKVIHSANETGDTLRRREEAVKLINAAIEHKSVEELLATLQSSDAQLPAVMEFAVDLYLEEFYNIRRENGVDLTHNELRGGVVVLSAVASVNLCIEAGDPDTTFDALRNETVHIVGVDPDCKQRYQVALENARSQKAFASGSCPLLTHLEIQECIIVENRRFQNENDKILAIQEINDALLRGNSGKTLAALINPHADVTDVNNSLGFLYHCVLQNDYQKKLENNDSSDTESVLWIDEIQSGVDLANELNVKALKFCKAIAAINMAIKEEDSNGFANLLRNSDIQFVSVRPECMRTYFQMLSDIKRERDLNLGEDVPMYVIYDGLDGICFFYYNIQTEESFWSCDPPSEDQLSCLLLKEEIQAVISAVTCEFDKDALRKSLVPHIIKLQACVRGFLVRHARRKRLRYLHSQEKAVVRIQAWWRGCSQRRAYLQRLKLFQQNVQSIVKIQAFVRMYLCRRRYLLRLAYLSSQVVSVVKIQTWWRGTKTRKAFRELINSGTPSFRCVQMFVHLLDVNDLDFSEELELHRLRAEVVKSIRHNQQLEKDLCTMDIKIGLLVKNRITLQDVVAHGKRMDRKTRESQDASGSSSGSGSGNLGLKSLSKCSRQKIEAYQHLFYLIQTEPRYLSHLIFLMLPVKTAKFIESIVLSLYNYASNLREEYLLLKLFKTALQEEINCKVDQPSDIITGNPLIIKMIVGFNRNRRGQSSLRDLLGPLVTQVLDDKSLHINTNPVEVYKTWVNQLETETGSPSGLPYNVTQDQALEHEEVKKQIQESVTSLKETTMVFFNAILSSLDKIPYGILLMAKSLKSALAKKFPGCPEKEILKVVGNLLYYRYINSAIVAPDAFDIVDIGANQSLTNEQRRNLGSVAKILQFATSKTGFGEESPHLVCLNPFIIECHEKFKNFFNTACDVEELEEHFKVDEYTEATMMTKPVIYISLQELCEMHLLLLEHESALAPDPEDPLHELLEDLGEKPSVEAMIGEHLDNLDSLQLAKTEVCLTLTNKFEIHESTKDDTNGLYVRTKQMVVDAMHCLEAADLQDMLKQKSNVEQNGKYLSLVRRRSKSNSLSAEGDEPQQIILQASSGSECSSLTLNDILEKIRHNLGLLELAGYVTNKDNYQDMINTVALDVRNRRRYRIRRRQDLLHLKTTLANLKTKTNFFEDQVDYYNEYIKQCLDNMTTVRKKSRKGGDSCTGEKKVKSKVTLKYTAAKLAEKGIIHSVDGLTPNQFKNVVFEIMPAEVPGVFSVKVKYMGTDLADVELDIQNLLELQYEGVAVMKMFDRAQVNVNLLLHLLNSKFYGRAK